MSPDLPFQHVTESIIGGFFAVYNDKGFGFLENVYANALQIELRDRLHVVQREVPQTIYYKSQPVGEYRADMIIDSCVIIEIKSTETLHPSAKRQLFNYLRATGTPVGLLLHFGPEPKFYRQVYTGKAPVDTPNEHPD